MSGNMIKRFYDEQFSKKTGWQGLSAADAIEAFINDLSRNGQDYLIRHVLVQQDNNACIWTKRDCRKYLEDRGMNPTDEQIDELWENISGIDDFMGEKGYRWFDAALDECSFAA